MTATKSYEKRLQETFDMAVIAKSYVESGYMSRNEFGEVFDQTVAIRALRIEGLDWLLFDQLISTTPHVPLVVHYRALAAGMRRSYQGITDFYARLIELGLLPPSVLNRTHFHHTPSSGRLGEMMVELGLFGQPTLQRALGIKEIIRQEAGVNVAVGQIFRSVGQLSIVDFFQALGMQVNVEFKSLDESAPEIYRVAMQREVRRTA